LNVNVTITCQLLTYEDATGPANMALDEALLQQVALQPDVAYLRTYGWGIPTLSLGYFQHLSEAMSETRWQAVPVVRRATGGGAIWHHHELTYALALPARHPLARRSVSLYRAVHAAIAAVFREYGLEIHPRVTRGSARSAERSAPRPFLCFSDSDPEDLVISGNKVVGSAQRRRSGAILQHGSILLRGSERTPELRGICDLADVPVEPDSWAVAIGQEIARWLELAPCPCEHVARDALHSRAVELQRSVYQNEAWTARRR
jgi:lipoate-protein ligase A